MPWGATTVNDVLKLYFNATAIANIADNAASAPLATLYLSLHTADPTSAGSQTTSEISYTGYARIAVTRTSGGWTVTGNVLTPVAAITFGQMTAGAGGTATYGMLGTASAGAGKQVFSGPISPTISVVNGVSPQFSTTSTFTVT